MLTTSVVAQAGMLVFGILWLREMPRRWRRDWHDLRHAPEIMERVVIGVIWLISLYFLWSILGFVVSGAGRIFNLG